MLNRKDFKCLNCNKWVLTNDLIGTKHRNHCPFCLWSRHVDSKRAGDRVSSCKSVMKPIGLTFKHEGYNHYSQIREGELMLIHQCTNPECGKITINRIAGDDNVESILRVFEQSLNIDHSVRKILNNSGIKFLSGKDRGKIQTQLFGKIS